MVDLHEAAEIAQSQKCPHCGDKCTEFFWCKHCGDITWLDEYQDDQLDKVNAELYRPDGSSGLCKDTSSS